MHNTNDGTGSSAGAPTLVQDAERAIVKANPPLPSGYSVERQSSVVRGDTTLPETTLRDMRAAHAKLSDEGFERRTPGAS